MLLWGEFIDIKALLIESRLNVLKVINLRTYTTPPFGHPSSKKRGVDAARNSPPF